MTMTTTPTSAPTLGEQLLRASDRLITPVTVSVALACAVALTLGLTALVVLGHSDVATVVRTAYRVLAGLGALVGPVALVALRHQLSRTEYSAAVAAGTVDPATREG